MLALKTLDHNLSLLTLVVSYQCVKKVINGLFFLCFQVGQRVGVKRCSDSTMHVYLEGEDKGIACTDVPKVRYQ